MTKIKDADFDLFTVRKEIVTYTHSLPDLIRHNGASSIGAVSLQIGKCFQWIGPKLDLYNWGNIPVLSVTDLGKELTRIGLELLDNPGQSDFEDTIATLKRQVTVLEKIARLKVQGGVL